MPKPKEFICGYTFCKHSGERVPSEIAVKDGSRYYHPDCHKEKLTKKQISDIYYQFYKSSEDYKVVMKAVNNLVNNQGYDASFVLYVLCQCIKEKVPYKSIFSLGWQVKNNMVYKNKYALLKSKNLIKKYSFDDVLCVNSETEFPEVKKEKKKRKTWADTLFK